MGGTGIAPTLVNSIFEFRAAMPLPPTATFLRQDYYTRPVVHPSYSLSGIAYYIHRDYRTSTLYTGGVLAWQYDAECHTGVQLTQDPYSDILELDCKFSV